jgi:hypothetical protein
MRRVTRILVIAFVAGVFAACGGSEERDVGVDQAASTAADGDTCSPADVDFASAAAEGARQECSGPWIYDKPCCKSGNTLATCAHAHVVTDWTTNVARPVLSQTCGQRCARKELTCDGSAYVSTTSGAPGQAFAAELEDAALTPNLPPPGCYYACVEWQTVCTNTYGECTASTPSVQNLLTSIATVRNGCKIDPTVGPVPSPAVKSVAVAANSVQCTVTYQGVAFGESSAGTVPNTCPSVADYVCGTPQYGACGTIGSTNPDGSTHGYVDPGYCPTNTKVVTDGNLTRAELDVLAYKPVTDERYELLCTTCEDRSASTNPTQAQADDKFNCYDTSLATPAVAGNTTLRDEVIRHAKLYFEYYGDRLSDPTRGATLYGAYPAVPACGVMGAFAPPPSTGCGSTAELDGLLTMCDRLRISHASARLAALEAKACIDAIAKVTALPATCTARQTYLDGDGGVKAAYTSAITGVLTKAFSQFEVADVPTARKAELQKRLALLGRFYAGVSGNDAASTVYSGANADARKWLDASAISGAIWSSFLAGDLTAFRNSGQTEADIAAFLTTGLSRDREMLSALFTDYTPPWTTVAAPPLTNAPALAVLSDALRSLDERLEQVAAYHDLGCRFKECVTVQPMTELVAMHDVVGALASSTGLRTAIDTGTTNQGHYLWSQYFTANWNTWKAAFDEVELEHDAVIAAAVRSALNRTTYVPEDLLNAKPGDPAPLVAIADTVRGAQKRAANYRAAGLFLSQGQKELPRGLLGSKIAAILQEVDTAQTEFHSYRQLYLDSRWQLVGYLLEDLDDQTKQNDLTARWMTLANRARQLAQDDAGLKISAVLEQARFGDAAKILEDASKVTDAMGQYLRVVNLPPGVPPVLSIEGANARAAWPGTGWTSVSGIAVQQVGAVWKLPLVAGSVVNLTTSGTYAPTCALDKQRFYAGTPLRIPTGQPSLAQAQTGPAGFFLSYSNGQFNVDSDSDVHTQTQSVSVEACAGFESPLSPAGFKASVKACTSYSDSQSSIDTNTTGTESRSGATYALGLRLPNTPFPRFPAGALLAVVVARDATLRGAILDVQVVQAPHATITVTAESDLYFVVNDYACGGGTGALSVSVTRLEPLAPKMGQMVTAMQQTVEALGTTGNAIVQQGRLLPSQMRDFKQQAWTRVIQNCNCDVYSYPEAIHAYFDQWLDTEVLRIERAIERKSIARDLQTIALEADAIERDLELGAAKGRLHVLLPTWSLRNLNLANDRMQAAASRMARLSGQVLYPMMHLRYPESLVGLTAPDGLLKVDWANASVDQLSARVDLLIAELKPRLQSAINGSYVDDGTGVYKLPTAVAAVRFVRPGTTIAWPNLPHGRVVTDGRASAIWAAIEEGIARAGTAETPNPINFQIFPEDLYEPGTTNTLLGCGDVAPAIKRMGFYVTSFDENIEDYNGDIRVPSHGPREMVFPTAAGLELFKLDPENVNASKVPLRYKAPDEALFDFEAPNYLGIYSLAQQGYSPFGAWQLEPLGVTGDPTGGLAAEFVVMFELETRSSAWLDGIGTCL